MLSRRRRFGTLVALPGSMCWGRARHCCPLPRTPILACGRPPPGMPCGFPPALAFSFAGIPAVQTLAAILNHGRNARGNDHLEEGTLRDDGADHRKRISRARRQSGTSPRLRAFPGGRSDIQFAMDSDGEFYIL